jgi:signal transduction histidine kinase
VIEVLTGRPWAYVVADLANCLIWGALVHFALVFPVPAPYVARRRWLVGAAYLSPFALHAVRVAISLPGTHGSLPRAAELLQVSQTAAHLHPLVMGAAMVTSYQNVADDDLARRRMRWAFVTFAVAAVSYLGLGQFPARVIGRPLIGWDWMILLFVPFPVALGVAVLRYRLFDIQVILRRSLVFGGLTVALGGLYLAVVTASSRLVHVPSALAPFAASLAVALLFGPLRTQTHRLVSRALFGDRDDPFEVLSSLSRRLEATASADSVLTSLVETLAQTLRLSYAAITLRDSDAQPVRYGTPGRTIVRIPITHAGEQVGDLEIDAGPGREPFGVADARLLDGLARQVGVISQNLLLESRLRGSLERVVTAREEERRRLRRDLHDGLGPTLASVGFQAELAGSLLDSDPARARAILAGLGAAQREAVIELRRLVDGLRPPVLDRLGLVGALRERAAQFGDGTGSAPAVTVEATPDVDPLPAAVEVAAFHITQESLTNIVKHARASRCVVRLRRDATALIIEVEDDGRGLSPGYRAGVGLGAIRERAEQVGGSATVTPGPRGGTVVRARLPVRAEP